MAIAATGSAVGAAEPAHLLKDIETRLTFDSGSDASLLCRVGGIVYFRAFTLDTGYEIWRTDGTEAGTYLLKDINPGPQGSFPAQLTAVNGALFFAAFDGDHGTELWRSDGTEAGTLLVKDLRPGPDSSFPSSPPAEGSSSPRPRRPTASSS